MKCKDVFSITLASCLMFMFFGWVFMMVFRQDIPNSKKIELREEILAECRNQGNATN